MKQLAATSPSTTPFVCALELRIEVSQNLVFQDLRMNILRTAGYVAIGDRSAWARYRSNTTELGPIRSDVNSSDEKED
jgi:hypothetical protein